MKTKKYKILNVSYYSKQISNNKVWTTKKKLYEYIDEFRTTFKPIYKVNGLYFCL